MRTAQKYLLYVICINLIYLPHSVLAASDKAAEERGAYIAVLGDCTACHTIPGHAAYAGGLPMNSPLGIIYSTNITPDPDHGIGRYTLEDFSRALREGVAKDGHHLYPAMPYTDFAQMSDEDVADLYAYVENDVKPAATDAPKTKLSFPFNQRWGLWFWDFLAFPPKGFVSEPAHDAKWQRGAYIVQGAGHCSSCHTARNILYIERGYSSQDSNFLTGNTLDNWYAPNLRSDKITGLGRWSEDEIVAFLKTGHGYGGSSFGAMTQVVEDSTQHMTNDDLHSIASYLKTLTAEQSTHSKTEPPNFQAYPIEHPGSGLYGGLCAKCHGDKGQGHNPDYPMLAGNPAVVTKNLASLIHLMLEGGASAHTDTGPKPKSMPSFAKLTDTEIGEVLSYIRQAWGNEAEPVSAARVTQMRDTLKKADAGKSKK